MEYLFNINVEKYRVFIRPMACLNPDHTHSKCPITPVTHTSIIDNSGVACTWNFWPSFTLSVKQEVWSPCPFFGHWPFIGQKMQMGERAIQCRQQPHIPKAVLLQEALCLYAANHWCFLISAV